MNLSVSELISHFPSHADSERKNVIGETFREEFRTEVHTIALDLEKRGLLTDLHELYDRLLTGELKPKELARALVKLTGLKALHKQDVIVLIDEYDTPTSHATHYGYFTEVCLHKPSMIWIFLNILKANIFRKVFAKSGCVYVHDLTTHLKLKL